MSRVAPRIRRPLPLAPEAQNARMLQVNAALAVQTVEAAHHIVRLTGARNPADLEHRSGPI